MERTLTDGRDGSFLSIARTWGSTPAERARPFPCDRFLPDPSETLFRAVDVRAPAAVVFRWLCQLRIAPYSYDWIDNLGRRSPRHLVPGLEKVAVGQRVMGAFELVEFETDRHLTVLFDGPGIVVRALGPIAASYVVVPRDTSSCRLVVKVVFRHRGPVIRSVLGVLTAWADLVMMRKQLLTLKGLAECNLH